VVETVGVVMGSVGLMGLVELVRRAVVGARFERSLTVVPRPTPDRDPGRATGARAARGARAT
jgi:hypothetical protein